MSRNLLSAVTLLFSFIFLLICCAICQSTYAQDAISPPLSDALVIFKSDKNFKNGGVSTIKYDSFTSPSLHYVDGLLVVFAQADDSKKCDIVEGYLKYEGGKLTEKFAEGDAEPQQTRRIVTKNNVDRCMGNPTTVVNDKDIYLFFKNSTFTHKDKFEYWVIGSQTKDDNGITWKASENLTTKHHSNIEDQETIISVDNGDIGIKVNNTFVVPVWYKKNNNKFISLITNQTKQVGEKWNLVLSKSFSEEKHPAVAEWENKLIMMTSSTKGYRKIYESINMGTEWKEALWSLSGVWGNLKKRTEENTKDEYGGRNGFIKVDFGKEKVLLVTQPVEIKEGAKHNLHLWMTDYQRVPLA